MAEWITVKEAARKLSVSERNVRFKIQSGKLKAKRDGRKWLVHSSLSPEVSDTEQIQETVLSDTIGYRTATEVTELLKGELEKRDTIIQEKDKQIARLQDELSQTSERHDTIVLQLTRQLEQSQHLLEYSAEPWYRRWFRKKHKEEIN